MHTWNLDAGELFNHFAPRGLTMEMVAEEARRERTLHIMIWTVRNAAAWSGIE